MQFKENRILRNLKKNVENHAIINNDILKPNLEYEKYKNLYQSFDSGKLTSTLINLDIEELCFCLACAILKYIDYSEKNAQN